MRTRISLVVILLSVLEAQAQVGAPQLIHQTIISPNRTAVADMDGDGRPDIVIASRLSTTTQGLAWARNLGGGTFEPVTPIGGNNRIPALALADMDGDADTDIVAADAQGMIFWFANLGTGGFSALQPIYQSTGTGTVNIALADLEGDGDTDVLFAGGAPAPGGYLLNNGLGDLGVAIPFTTPIAGTFQLRTGDLDGDADMDVLISAGSTLQWHENAGDGSFPTAHLIYSNSNYAHESSVVADMDGDGDQDVVTGTYSGIQVLKQLLYFENTGAGVFAAPVVLTTSTLVSDYRGAFEAVDMDGDLDLDLVMEAEVGSSAVQTAQWFPNNGDATFEDAEVVPVDMPVFVSPADLDNDGDMDLVSTSSDVKVETWTNNGTGGLVKDRVVTTKYFLGNSVAIGDVDGDGDQDAVIGQANNNALLWTENCGNNSFDTAHYMYAGWSGADTEVALEDLDGDGNMDILWRRQATGGIGWCHNLGGGTFAPPDQLAAVTGQGSLQLWDLDGDGDRDILVDDNRVHWYVNEGDGTITSALYGNITASNANQWSFLLSDVDVDGDQDVVTVITTDVSIQWHENVSGYNTVGTPQVHVMSTGSAELGSVTMADLDMDGDDDLAYQQAASDDVVWKRNDGTGVFGAEELLFPLDGFLGRMRGVDLNLDGWPDLLIQTSDSICWARALGAGAFALPVMLIDSATTTWNMALADMDGDGALDLLYDHQDLPFPLLWAANQLPSGTFVSAPSGAGHALQCAPVPFTDQAVLSADRPFAFGAVFHLRDAYGRVVHAQTVGGLRAVTVFRRGLPSGVYMAVVAEPGLAPRSVRVVID